MELYLFLFSLYYELTLQCYTDKCTKHVYPSQQNKRYTILEINIYLIKWQKCYIFI